MISFALEEDQQIIQETVRSFARDVIRPHYRAWERTHGVPAEARRRFYELGLGLLDVPEALGGGGAGLVTAALVQEELAWGDPGAAVALWAPHTAAAALCELGDAAQVGPLLARLAEAPDRLGAVAYSERNGPLAGFGTVAERRGDAWVLRGHKAFVVNGGRAELTVVFAQIDPSRGWDGVGVFVVPAGTPGLREGARHELLGLETLPVSEVVLEDCVVPEALRLRGGDHLAASFARWLGRVGLMTAARQVGLARASYEYALEYTQERKAFGKPVAHFQAIAFTLAEMLMDVEAARWMVWRAAASYDRGQPGSPDLGLVAQAAVHANEAAWRVADQGVQLLGGAGYIQDYPAEKWLRDTKALALLGPGDQLAQLTVATAELGQTLDPVWPSLALQPLVS
jgi:alkylation response protein AidB-like acyl-CoA dehydrogenase